jgi:hypothetical protein
VRRPGVDGLERHLDATRDQVVEPTVVDDEGSTARRQTIGDLGEEGRVFRRLEDDGHGAAVADDPLDLLGGGGLVDRDGRGPRSEDGVVELGPLAPRVAHQRDPVPRLDADGDEAGGQLADALPHLAGGDVHEAVTVAVGEQRTFRCPLRVP